MTTNIEEKNIEKDQDTEKTLPSKNKNKVLIIILAVVIIIVSITAIVISSNSSNEKEEEKSKTSQHTLDVYIHKYGSSCEKGEKDCYLAVQIPAPKGSRVINTLEIEADDYLERIKMVLYADGKDLKIYNVATKKVKDLKIKEYYRDYQIQPSYNYKDAIGLVLTDYDNKTEKETYLYYDIEKDEILINNLYTKIYPKQGDYIEVEEDENLDNDNFDWDKYKVHLYNLKEQKEVLTESGTPVSFDIEQKNNNVYIYKNYGGIGETASTLYNEEYKVLVDSKSPHEWGFTKENNIYQLDGNKVITTNYKGETISTSKEYKNILHVTEEYIMYHDNKKLYITDDKDFTKELLEWKKGYYYHSMISGYFDDKWLESENKDPGYYFVIEYDKNDYSGVDVYFNPETKETKRYELEEIAGYAKPVLYLYPEQKTNVTINFEKEDNLTTTYPKFKEEWEVTAYPNGDLYDKEGKYYYGLYWEENSNHTVDFSEGFYVSKDNAIEFLEEKLSIIGLNDKERNEFIMYWLPILEKNEHNLIYFELTEERNDFNEIEISPKPDSLLRVAIHVKKVDRKQIIKEQRLESFERIGFTAVEWGGILYK